jgi:hypothetical protein
MLTIRLSLVLAVTTLLVACTPQRPQVASPQAINETLGPNEDEWEDYLDLIILDPLPEGCEFRALSSYDSRGKDRLVMYHDRLEKNRFNAPVLNTNTKPVFEVDLLCYPVGYDMYQDRDSVEPEDKEFHGKMEAWRRDPNGSWTQLSLQPQYEGRPSN